MGYYVEPKVEPIAYPRIQPKIGAPSGLGDEGIVANWLMYYLRGGDHLHDFSPYDNHGTINGASWKDGRYGWCLDFIRSEEDYVDCGTGINPTTKVTVSFWIKPGNLADWQSIIQENTYKFTFRVSPTVDGIYESIQDVNGNQSVVNFGDMSDKGWHYVTVTADTTGDSVKCYMDGDVKATDSPGYTGDLAVSKSNILTIGEFNGSDYLEGLLGLVRIYKVVKSDSWILRRFERTRGLFGV